jgi:hypothetical protein
MDFGSFASVHAKHHPGAKIWVGGDTLLVNGQRQPYVRNSRHEAARASRLLSAVCGFPVSVTGVVVLVRAEIKVKVPPEDVHVLGWLRLAKWLRHQPSTLDEATIASIFDAARKSTTWQLPN